MKTDQSGGTRPRISEVIRILLTGTMLKGRYCILDTIGKGGQGSLYLARDTELGIWRAVKEIPLSGKREAKLLRLLDHPAMPAMLDYVEKTEYCYLVTEYIKGKSLGALLSEGRVFSAKEILDYARAAADVLSYLHARKPPVYYGDLKPDNLMLSENGKLYLVDYGSAVPGYSGRSRTCSGTRGYAAPEQYEGRINERSDVYALGRTIYRLMGKNRRKVFLACPGLFRVLLRCCRRNEKLRYGGAGEVLRELEKLRVRSGALLLSAKLLAGSAFLLVGFALSLGTGKEDNDFGEALAQVTEQYYQEAFLEGDGRERIEICRRAGRELDALAASFLQDSEQERILLLQAANSEIAEDWEEAELCYRKLLREHEDFSGGYTAYGMYLWRRNRYEESADLWEMFQKKRREYSFAETDPEWERWEEAIYDWKTKG